MSRVEARNLLQRGEHKRKVFVVRFVLIPAFAVFIMLLLKQLQCSARSLWKAQAAKETAEAAAATADLEVTQAQRGNAAVKSMRRPFEAAQMY